MDPKQIAKQMIVFNKTAFDNNFQAMQAWHEQTERLVNKFWETTPMFPEEGKKAIKARDNAIGELEALNKQLEEGRR